MGGTNFDSISPQQRNSQKLTGYSFFSAACTNVYTHIQTTCLCVCAKACVPSSSKQASWQTPRGQPRIAAEPVKFKRGTDRLPPAGPPTSHLAFLLRRRGRWGPVWLVLRLCLCSLSGGGTSPALVWSFPRRLQDGPGAGVSGGDQHWEESALCPVWKLAVCSS